MGCGSTTLVPIDDAFFHNEKHLLRNLYIVNRITATIAASLPDLSDPTFSHKPSNSAPVLVPAISD